MTITAPRTRILAIALAAVAAIAPAAAQAKPADLPLRGSHVQQHQPETRYTPQDRASALAQERYFQSYAQTHAQRVDKRSPDAIDAAQPRPTVDLRTPDAIDAMKPRPNGSPTLAPIDARRPVDLPPTVDPTGFDWPSAGIGAAAAFVLILLALTGVALTGRRRALLS